LIAVGSKIEGGKKSEKDSFTALVKRLDFQTQLGLFLLLQD